MLLTTALEGRHAGSMDSRVRLLVGESRRAICSPWHLGQAS